MNQSVQRALQDVGHVVNYHGRALSRQNYQAYLEALLAECQRRLLACKPVAPAPIPADLPTLAGEALMGGPVDHGARTLGRLSDEGADVLRQALGGQAEEHL